MGPVGRTQLRVLGCLSENTLGPRSPPYTADRELNLKSEFLFTMRERERKRDQVFVFLPEEIFA